MRHSLACAVLGRYDLHGGWEKITGEHTALTSVVGDTDTVEQGVKNWLQGGAPASKVVLGLAAYGHGWTLANQSDTGLGAPTTGGSAPGPYSNASGILTFGEIQREGTSTYPLSELYPSQFASPFWESSNALACAFQEVTPPPPYLFVLMPT